MRLSTLEKSPLDGVVRDRETLPATIDGGEPPAFARDVSYEGPQLDPALAGQLRDLLNNLAHGQAVHRTPQRLAITGVHLDTEAAFLASTIAMTAARSGYRVLLVDANFRNPSVHRTFGLSTSRGLSTLLSSPNPPHSVPQATPVPNLAAITIGPDAGNWSSLVNREQIFHRLEPLASSFDYIVIDCGNPAPALVGRISAGADSVVIAVKEHVSSMRELTAIVDALRAEGVAEPAILMVA